MVFSTIIFLLRFLPITLALYYLAPPKLKNTVLFLCSLVFYCWGEVRFFPVMLALILINYLCGLGLERFEQNKTARLILLLIALVTGIVKLPEVEGAGNFLLDTMTMMFIPAAVGIMSAIDILLPVLLPYLVIIVVSTVLVMVVTGLTATAILRRRESKEDQDAEAAELSLEPHETFGLGRRTLSPNGEIDGANGYREILHEKEVQRHASQAEANASDAAQMTSAEAERKEEA